MNLSSYSTPHSLFTRTARSTAMGALLAILGGCGAAQLHSPTTHRAGPDAAAGGTFGFSQLAFGRPTGDRSVQSDLDLTPYMRADYRKTREPAGAPPSPRPARPTEAPALPPAPRPAPAPAPARAPAIAAVTVPTRAPAPAASTSADPLAEDAARYAVREATASEQSQFRGGDVIVISMSTIIVALLVLILVLLLT